MHAYLPLSVVERYVPDAQARGVSEVARSRRGFLTAYRAAGGRAERLSPYWRNRREGFVARHLAQLRANGEPLREGDALTRRHLALVMWAYSPAPKTL